MKYNVEADLDYLEIMKDVRQSAGVLKDLWINYKGNPWYPKLIKDSATGKIGFEVNSSGKWGSNKEVGREKVSLAELVDILASNRLGPKAAVRCVKLPRGTGDGRRLSDHQLSERLKRLIAAVRSNQSSLPGSEHSAGRPLQQDGHVQQAILATAPQAAPTPDAGVPNEDQATLESETAQLNTSERQAVVNIRFGQGGFRDALIRIAGEKCWMSGIEGKRLLIASHIKPWAHCREDAESRGQCDNGLLLSSLWDAAFDSGLITFSSNWQVEASAELSGSARAALGLETRRDLPGQFRTTRRLSYLAYHRERVFEYWKKSGLG